MKVKICGITQYEQVREINKLDIDYIGFIFYPSSKRSMVDKLLPEEIVNMDLAVNKVGVFVNEPVANVLKKVNDYNLQVVQLHGDETVSYCNEISSHVKLIKAFRIGESGQDIDRLVRDYEDACDFYMFDKGSSAVYGGTGEKFDWNVLGNAKINKPFFLSGGISIDDVDAIRNFSHPFFYGVDLNSRFEISAGVKDMNLVREFLSLLEEHRAHQENKTV